jgi:transposase
MEHRPFSPRDPELRAAMRADVFDRVVAGEDIGAIAKEFRVNFGTIEYHVRREKMRRDGTLPVRKHGNANRERNAKVLAMVESGKTYKEIGAIVGCTRQNVGLIINRHREANGQPRREKVRRQPPAKAAVAVRQASKPVLKPVIKPVIKRAKVSVPKGPVHVNGTDKRETGAVRFLRALFGR